MNAVAAVLVEMKLPSDQTKYVLVFVSYNVYNLYCLVVCLFGGALHVFQSRLRFWCE